MTDLFGNIRTYGQAVRQIQYIQNDRCRAAARPGGPHQNHESCRRSNLIERHAILKALRAGVVNHELWWGRHGV